MKNLILEILHVFLRLKFSPALTLTKLKRFESGSLVKMLNNLLQNICQDINFIYNELNSFI